MVTVECVEKLIRKDMVDPVNGEKLTDRDIIVLQRVSGAAPPAPRPRPQRRPRPRPPDPRCPGASARLHLDLPTLQGGTGFAGSGVKLHAEKSRPVMQA